MNNTWGKIKEWVSDFFDKDASKSILEPRRDWMIAVGIAFVATSLFALIGLYLFIQMNKGEIFITRTAAEPLQTIDRMKLEEVVKKNKEQGAVLDGLLLNRPQIVDPSR